MKIIRVGFGSIVMGVMVLCFAGNASAKNCRKGIPCGNSCISANKVCRIGGGSSSDYKYNSPSTGESRTNKRSDIPSLKSSTSGANSTSKRFSSNKGVAQSTAGDSNTPQKADANEIYSCLYSRYDTHNKKYQVIPEGLYEKVTYRGKQFIASRPNGTNIYSSELAMGANGYGAKDFSKEYSMRINRVEFEVIDTIAKTKERWTACERKK